MDAKRIKIGDPVEVRFATHDGYLWLPATVVHVDAFKLGVAYSDGRREALPHGENRYRVPQKNFA